MKIVPVILAGGVGERFWPLSRSSRPKQLLPISSKQSMLEETLRRVTSLSGKSTRPLIVTGQSMVPKIKKNIPAELPYDLIAEPMGKNTAPAVALAASWIERKWGEAVMVVLSADHAISPKRDFLAAVRFAASLAAKQDRLVVFGIVPQRPDTGYGYVHLGTQVDEKGPIKALEVKRFVEKPDAKTAAKYVRSKKYLWNSGMFVWRTSVIINEFKSHMPQLCDQVFEAASARFSRAAVRKFYQNCVKESIDYGILEQSDRVMCVQGTFGWDDVGSWEALARLHPQDARENTIVGEKVFQGDCRQTIIMNDSPLTVAAVGLEDIVLVAAHDSILAISRDKLPEMKKYLAQVKSDSRFPPELF